ncbi:pyrimidine reductase family protein [Arthrobacter zhaoguopingii]|uniref:pyrimidine reductase family protein n=1 Tax=Arthrobacter zhaoguopingii TaxID=2681491 RepID=UPI00135B7775|nr:pyrimidine reductase family protein [Arthrobacter zhaoguopingii]
MITSLLPGAPGPLTEADLLAEYAYPPSPGPFVRFNFIASADGAASVTGRSGGLGNDGDRLIFALLRRLADVILVGAGTVRAEGYEGGLIDPDARAARRASGRAGHPAVAVISGSLDLDPASGFFAAPPARPLIFTTTAAGPGRRRALERVADVVDCGDSAVDPAQVVRHLAGRGLGRVLCEGGPAVLASFTAAGLVDELCLSLSPLLVGGEGPRISNGTGPPQPAPLRLVSLLHEESALYARYVRR